MKRLLTVIFIVISTISYSQNYLGYGLLVPSDKNAVPGVNCSSTLRCTLKPLRTEIVSGTELNFYMGVEPGSATRSYIYNEDELLIFENWHSNTGNVNVQCVQDCYYNTNHVNNRTIYPGYRDAILVRRNQAGSLIGEPMQSPTLYQYPGYKTIRIKITNLTTVTLHINVWHTIQCYCNYINPPGPVPCASVSQTIVVRPAGYIIEPKIPFARANHTTGCNDCTHSLEWTDWSVDETGFDVYVSTDNVNYSLAISLPANTIYWGFKKQSGTRYYRIKTRKGTNSSQFSQTVTVN